MYGYSGTINMPSLKTIDASDPGEGSILGTLPIPIGGAAPGKPPLGVVVTTWLGGNGSLSLKLASIRSSACVK